MQCFREVPFFDVSFNWRQSMNLAGSEKKELEKKVHKTDKTYLFELIFGPHIV